MKAPSNDTQHQDADWIKMDEAVGSCIVTVALMALRKVNLVFVSLGILAACDYRLQTAFCIRNNRKMYRLSFCDPRD
jgi:phosphatidylglycerophosphatase A